MLHCNRNSATIVTNYYLHLVLPPSDDPITLINETPRVDRVGTVASVRVEFTLRSDVRNVICDLRDVFDVPDNPQDCKFKYNYGL